MKLKVKDMDIATGGPLVVVLNAKDASKLDLHPLDRVKIRKGNNVQTALVDVGESKKAAPHGKIGVFEEVLDSLNAADGDILEIIPARKPLSLEYIKKKLDGQDLSKQEIDQIVWDIVHNKLDDIELTYFVSACYSHELSTKETTMLTKAMAKYGDKLKLNRGMVMDKHCVGGVCGNRTTMVIVPIIASAGLAIPKTSSRSITSPAGTADTMEVLANVSVPINKMKRIVERTNGCIVWGGSLNLAPADDKIIRVERPLWIDAKSQLLASVMAKKSSVSATHLLVDIPFGEEAKLSSKRKAMMLRDDFKKLARSLGIKTKVILTDGSQPIGDGIGPALEARDVLWILKNNSRGPSDLRKKSLMMAGIMLEMAGRKNGYKLAKEILESGKAYRKMVEIIKAQGAKITEPDEIKIGRFEYSCKSTKQGAVAKILNRPVSKLARIAGAPVDQGAGIYLHKHVGDKVRKGEKILTIYAESKIKLNYAIQAFKNMDGIKVK